MATAKVGTVGVKSVVTPATPKTATPVAKPAAPVVPQGKSTYQPPAPATKKKLPGLGNKPMKGLWTRHILQGL